MATHKSAEKRHRQSLKKRDRNRFAKSSIRTTLKKALSLAEAGKVEEAKAAAKLATKLLDKAAVHGVVHKKNAARRISRLTTGIAAAAKATSTDKKSAKKQAAA